MHPQTQRPQVSLYLDKPVNLTLTDVASLPIYMPNYFHKFPLLPQPIPTNGKVTFNYNQKT